MLQQSANFTEPGLVLNNGDVVMVTGAGGSIGRELCRRILRVGPRRLILLDRSEFQLFQIQQELEELGGLGVLVPIVADITIMRQVREIFHRYRPDILFHAAAHKHVPMMEAQPSEAIHNNLFGTANLVRISHEFEINSFVLISTDKAVNPTSVMGVSKRMAEMFLQGFQRAYPNPVRFITVRFGNVLGSSGSVLPTFIRQIAAGGPVKVTHPDVSRYFVTISDSISLILHAVTHGQGGEIFVLDMGKPVKILDLACRLIHLLQPQTDKKIEIKFVGLRPGEKLSEELCHYHEQVKVTGHPRIFRLISEPIALSRLESYFGHLESLLYSADACDLKRFIQKVVPEYKPFLS